MTPEVPGPPRGRRPVFGGTLRQRVEDMAVAEAGTGPVATWRSMLRLLRDVILLLKDLAVDPRVSSGNRWIPVGLAVAYVASPRDLVPDRIPVLGRIDDVAVIVWAVRRLLAAAGYEVIYELWRGTDEGLAVVLTMAGVQD